MRVGVWGIGGVGTGLACRLATTSFVSEITLINRTYAVAEGRAIDISHGLAFATTCCSARPLAEARVASRLSDFDVLVLTQGGKVGKGGDRGATYGSSRAVYRESVVAQIRDFGGVVLVVTNPVDLIARLVHVEAGLPSERVLGLGTVVETARLRAAIAANAIPQRAPHEGWSYVIGTHDPLCVCVPLEHAGPSLSVSPTDLEMAREEVTQGAERVKNTKEMMGTLHPIVEGAVAVIEALATDARRTMTVSVLDPGSPDKLFYSMPCTLGATGVLHRFDDLLANPDTKKKVDAGAAGLKAILDAAGP